MTTKDLPNETGFADSRVIGLWKEADAIQELLLRHMDLQDPAGLTWHLAELDAQMARLSEMTVVADTLREFERRRYETENADKLNEVTATISNRMIKNALFEYTALSDRLKAMYGEGQTQRRDCITQISWIKEQMKQFNTNP